MFNDYDMVESEVKKIFVFDVDKTLLNLNISKSDFEKLKLEICDYINSFFENEKIIYQKITIEDLSPILIKTRILSFLVDESKRKEFIRKIFDLLDNVELSSFVSFDEYNLIIKKINPNLIYMITNNGRRPITKIIKKIFNIKNLNLNSNLITRDDIFYPKPFFDPFEKLYEEINKRIKIKQKNNLNNILLNKNKKFIHEILFFSDNLYDLISFFSYNKSKKYTNYFKIKYFMVKESTLRNIYEIDFKSQIFKKVNFDDFL